MKNNKNFDFLAMDAAIAAINCMDGNELAALRDKLYDITNERAEKHRQKIMDAIQEAINDGCIITFIDKNHENYVNFDKESESFFDISL